MLIPLGSLGSGNFDLKRQRKFPRVESQTSTRAPIFRPLLDLEKALPFFMLSSFLLGQKNSPRLSPVENGTANRLLSSILK